MSGSGGDRGYDFQADAYAYVVAHGLAGQPLAWFDDIEDVPCALAMETGGAGDDLRIWTRTGVSFEVQAKHALRNDDKFTTAVMRLLQGLHQQPASRGILFVDRHASEIIREGFRRDVIRFGQGRTDNMSEVFRGTLASVQAAGLGTPDLFQRLRVVVVDLDDGSDGVAAARALLAHVVPPDRSLAAFRLLGKQGHQLTKERGQQDIGRVAAYLDREVGLSSQGGSPAWLWHRYQTWLNKTTQEFFCTALNARFPIGQAWDRVKALDRPQDEPSLGEDHLARQIARYHEWQRLAREWRFADTVEAHAWAVFARRSVIVGGPGSGKSTLSQRLTNVLVSMGHSVFRVRLTVVQGLMDRGRTFDEAISLASTDGAGLSPAQACSLRSAAWLIADGLDECDPSRADIAAKVKEWADGHPYSGVCVLTRPIGHTPEFLPGFRHAELLPLDKDAVHTRSRWFFGVVARNQQDGDTLCGRFEADLAMLRSDSVVSLAARSPLMLGFLVRLSADGQKLQVNRSDLFAKVIDCMHKTPHLHRKAIEVDPAVARHAVGAIGFSVLERPARPVNEVVQTVSLEFGKGMSAEQAADRAIAFWEAQGLIERITAGSLDALTFIHPSLGEYAAGKYISELDANDLRKLIVANRHSPRWREPFLHAAALGAAQGIVRTLLEMDDPTDPGSAEAMLAAAVAKDTSVDRPLLIEVVRRLCDRMASPVPFVAATAASALADLSLQAAPLLAESVVGYLAHPQPWTGALALAVAIVADAPYVTTDQLCQWVQDYPAVRSEVAWEEGRLRLAGDGAELRSPSLVHAIQRLMKELPPDEAKEVLQHLLREGRISARDYLLVAEVARYAGHEDWVKEVKTWSGVEQDIMDSMAAGREKSVAATQFILECILAASRLGDQALQGGSGTTYFNIAQLMEAMQGWDMPVSEWYGLAKRENGEAIVEVVRGALVALALDPVQVAKEAGDLLKRSQAEADTLFSMLPRGPVEPVWSRAKGLGLDWKKVVAALRSLCPLVSLTATHLIDGSGMARDLSSQIKGVLYEGRGISLYLVGMLAKAAWGEEAFSVLLDRLEKPLVPGCGYLFAWLVDSASAEQMGSACHCILNSLFGEDSEIAADGPAEQLGSIPSELLGLRVAQLRASLEHWNAHGAWCRRCQRPVPVSSCPTCGVIPRDPRPAIVKVLARVNGLTIDELLKLVQNPRQDVAGSAADALAALGEADSVVMVRLVKEITEGKAGMPVLRAILKLPTDVLRQQSSVLLPFLQSENDPIRAEFVSSLSGQWIDQARALPLIETALVDKSPRVRSSAARTLRIRRQNANG